MPASIPWPIPVMRPLIVRVAGLAGATHAASAATSTPMAARRTGPAMDGTTTLWPAGPTAAGHGRDLRPLM